MDFISENRKATDNIFNESQKIKSFTSLFYEGYFC